MIKANAAMVSVAVCISLPLCARILYIPEFHHCLTSGVHHKFFMMMLPD